MCQLIIFPKIFFVHLSSISFGTSDNIKLRNFSKPWYVLGIFRQRALLFLFFTSCFVKSWILLTIALAYKSPFWSNVLYWGAFHARAIDDYWGQECFEKSSPRRKIPWSEVLHLFSTLKSTAPRKQHINLAFNAIGSNRMKWPQNGQNEMSFPLGWSSK